MPKKDFIDLNKKVNVTKMLKALAKLIFVHRKVVVLWLFAAGLVLIWLLKRQAYDHSVQLSYRRDFRPSMEKLYAMIPWVISSGKMYRRNDSNGSEKRKPCKLPKVNPFNKIVMKNIHDYGPLECKGSEFSKIVNGTLVIQSNGIQLTRVVYSPIERPTGDDFNFKLGKSEVILSPRVRKEESNILATDFNIHPLMTGYQGCLQHASGKCIHPYGGDDIPEDGNPIVLHSDCCLKRIHFVLEGNGIIKHKTSGKCLQPESADGSPHELEENTALVLSSSCDSTTGTFQVWENGSLQHIPSKLCVHPAENNLDSQDDEKLVLRKECGTEQMAFFMYEERADNNNMTFTRPISSDFVQVEILQGDIIEKEFHLHAVPKADVNARPISRKGLRMNVIALMFDSTSAANWQRLMRKSNNYLHTHLNAISFKGHSVVGDGTTAQLCAMLTGIAEENEPEARRRMVGSKPVDDWQWIFKEYKKHGYATLFTEDDPGIATFNYRLEGFSSPPTDHYARNFWLALQEYNYDKEQSSFCIGAQAIHNLTLGYIESFMEAYPNRPKFAFGIFSSLTHSDQNGISYSDKDFQRFLKRLEIGGHLANTIFITFGDHGPRFSDFRKMIQGKLEERLPHFSIALPFWFKEKYSTLYKQLKHNSGILTSHFDTYAMLRHVLTYPDYPQGIKTGASLFTKFNSKTRTCADAGIPLHWCPCMKWENFEVHQQVVMDIALAVIKEINNMTSHGELGNLCERLRLKKINSVLREMPSDIVQKFKNTKAVEKCDSCEPVFGEKNQDKSFKDNLYQIQFVTKPGDGEFEASVRVWNGKVLVTNTHISRINKYGNQSKCVKYSHTHLSRYCYCKYQQPTQE